MHGNFLSASELARRCWPRIKVMFNPYDQGAVVAVDSAVPRRDDGSSSPDRDDPSSGGSYPGLAAAIGRFALAGGDAPVPGQPHRHAHGPAGIRYKPYTSEPGGPAF